MSWPRLTLRGMMVTVGVVAIDIAATRWLYQRTLESTVVVGPLVGLGLLPSLNALCIGLAMMGRQWLRMRTRAPFLLGFQVIGWPVIVSLVVVAMTRPDDAGEWLSDYLNVTSPAIISLFEAAGAMTWLRGHEDVATVVEVLFVSVVLGGPPLILPFLGGLAARVVAHRMRTPPTDPAPSLSGRSS